MHCFFFFFNDTATTEIYTLSLHDALPISATSTATPSTGHMSRGVSCAATRSSCGSTVERSESIPAGSTDRKSTRLNSSHLVISYAVFCLKKKKQRYMDTRRAGDRADDLIS